MTLQRRRSVEQPNGSLGRRESGSQPKCLYRRRGFTQPCTITISEPDSALAASKHADIQSSYIMVKVLGQGTASVVYKARCRNSGKTVAIKYVRSDDDEVLRAAKDEYNILKDVQHPYIVGAIDFRMCSRGACLALEYFSSSTLTAAVKGSADGKLSEQSARPLFGHLMDATAYLHRQGIVHCDIKTDNMLVNAGLTDLRLIDFNSSRNAQNIGDVLCMRGTPAYYPPEVLRGGSAEEAGDVWACGLCLHLMLQGALPLESLGREQMIEQLFSSGVRLEGESWVSISAACRASLQSTLQVDPLCRASASEALSGAWLAAQ